MDNISVGSGLRVKDSAQPCSPLGRPALENTMSWIVQFANESAAGVHRQVPRKSGLALRQDRPGYGRGIYSVWVSGEMAVAMISQPFAVVAGKRVR